MMRSGKCYPQPRLVRHTKETGYSLWPTPSAGDNSNRQSKPCPAELEGRHGWKLKPAVMDSLSETPTRMWPTPRAQMGSLHQPSADKPHEGGGKPKRLEVEVGRQMWPTPDVPNGGRGIPRDAVIRGNSVYTQDGRKVQVGLANAVKMWPTPTGQMARPDFARATRESCHGGDDLGTAVHLSRGETSQSSGQLNPQFVSWLMGFPIDWCDMPEEYQAEPQIESPSCDA